MTTGLVDYPAVMLRYQTYVNSGYGARRGIPEAVSEPDAVDSNFMSAPFKAIFNPVQHFLNKQFAGVYTSAIEMLAEQDPIAALSSVGDWFLDIAWGLLTALGATSLGAATAGIISERLPALGSVIGQVSMALGPYIIFILFAVFLPLAIYGITLAFFLPAIPFIRWMAGLGAWIILLVESLVAAPLWLAAHALPEGEGLAGQHGKRGYMLLLGILLRPPLMVAGFFAAILLINVMGRLIGEIFLLFTAGVSQTKTVGLVGSISMLIILGITVIMLTNKFFGLMQHLPEHIINWIGQQFHSLGEKEDSARAQSSFGGSTAAVSSTGHGLSGKASGYFADKKEQLARDKLKRGKANITPGNTGSNRAPDQSSLV
jgi:conjugal transfer/type IV secretion protein DotA/TraY